MWYNVQSTFIFKYSVHVHYLSARKGMKYRNFPKFSDRQVWANSADPDQTAPRSSLIRVYTVCHSVCIVWTHYSMVDPHSSNFRVITTIFLGVRIFRKFTVIFSFVQIITVYLIEWNKRIICIAGSYDQKIRKLTILKFQLMDSYLTHIFAHFKLFKQTPGATGCSARWNGR